MAVLDALIDRARDKAKLPSDNALAIHLGLARQTVSQWRREGKYPDEEVIVRLAEMAHEDPGQWLVAIKAVRADGKAGKVWAALAKRLGAAAAVVMLGVMLALPLHADASQPGFEQGRSMHYAKLRAGAIRRLW